MSILVVGSIALDTIRTPSGSVTEVLGGSATYFSYAASLFSDVRVVGAVGADFPQECTRSFLDRRIDITGLEVCEGRTFRWDGRYGDNLNEATTLSVSLNVMENFRPRLQEIHRRCEYVFLANIAPEIQSDVLRQVDSRRLAVCDTMNHWIRDRRASLAELIERVDILVLNDGEARMLSGVGNLIAAARVLRAMGPRAVIIKKGEHGVLLATEDDLFLLPAFPVEHVIDPTGAGDSFGGGFLGYLASSGDLSPAGMRRAVVYGAVVASFTVEDFGTRGLEKIRREDVEQRAERIRRQVSF